MKKAWFSDEEREAVAEAVGEAESKTSGEITTALIPESSDYAFYELRAAAGFGILLYMILLFFYDQTASFVSGFFWNSSAWQVSLFMGIISLLGGGIFYFFSNIPAIDRIIVPGKVMQKRVRARALRHFSESGVYSTADGTGILIFISLLERRVELIADRGINEKISAEQWNGIVSELTVMISKGEAASGLVRAITRCGDLLKEHFPIAEDDVNELSDALVILEE